MVKNHEGFWRNDLVAAATVATTATAAEATAVTAAETTTATAAAEAAAITAAEAATIATAEAAARTAAEPVSAAKAIAAAEPVTTAKAITTTGEGIETILTETVPLVAAPATTPSIKTHKPEQTFASPQFAQSGGADDSRRTTGRNTARPSPLHRA